MKNSVILVLVILVLYFIYTNLQNNTSMEGGGNEDCDKFKKVVEKLIKSDGLYSSTIGNMPGFIVYIILFIALIGVGIHYGRQAMYFNGVVIPGYGSLAQGYSTIDWMSSGLYKFYLVRQDMFFFTGKNSSGKSGTTTNEDEADFKALIEDLKTPTYKPAVQYFCDRILPCSTAVNTACNCAGADPKKCIEQSSPSAKAIIEANKKSAQYFFGIIPKCCCTKLGAAVIPLNPKNKATPTLTNNLTITLPSCTNGSETPIIPGVSADSKDSNQKVISKMVSDAAKECKDVDCSEEPNYNLLAIPLYLENGNINPAWTAEANKYPTPADLLAATPSSVIQDALRNSSYALTPGYVQIVPNVVNKDAINARPYIQSPFKMPPPGDLTNSLTNPPVQNFTGGIALKKESPNAKIIDEQIKRSETFKQPDSIETLLTEPPKKSKLLFKKK
jgi:hypothetical protein